MARKPRHEHRSRTVNYAPAQDMGLLVDGFETPPALLEVYNPPYYQDLLIAAGYQQSRAGATYHGHTFEFEHEVPGLMAEAARICARCNLTIRPVDLSNAKREAALLTDIFNDAFASSREMIPVPEEVFQFRAGSVIRIIDPRIFLFVERRGETLGVGLALPNFNEVLARCEGKLGLGKILRWKKTVQSIQTAVAVLLCARPKAHGLGISRVLLAHLLQGGLSGGYTGFHGGFVDQRNNVMRAALKRIGYPHPHKRYAIFKKDL